jgi:thiol-disulfide isomerase/thioredoxin
MSRLLVIGCVLFMNLSLLAQDKVRIPTHDGEMKVGEKMPDVLIPHINNYPVNQVRLSAFRGKLVILDFWWTGCSGCIEKFPEMQKMQDKFGDKIQIMLVNYEAQKDIAATFARMHRRNPIYAMVDLPSVTGDTIFEHLFPHTLVPHEVWIDGGGTIRAITSAHEVNEDNIRNMLSDAAFTLPEKRDLFTHDPFKPALPQIYQLDPEALAYSSAILKFYPGMRGPVVNKAIDSFTRTIRITRTNHNILELLGEPLLGHSPTASSDPSRSTEFDYGKRIIIDGVDSDRLFYNAKNFPRLDDWDQLNRYTYEEVLPLDMQASLYPVMLENLERYFHLHARIEQRTLPCLALVRISAVDKIRSNGPVTDALYDAHRTQYYDWTMEGFRGLLSFKNRQTPLLFKDDTGYTGRVTIDLSSDLKDLPALKQELRAKYDLDLVERKEPMSVMVISKD